MPRRYRRKKPARRRPKQPWYHRQYSATQLARKAWKAFKWVKGNLNTERKLLDTVSAANPCDTNGTITHVSNVLRGDNYNTRDGRQAKLKSIHWKGIFRIQGATNVDTVRYMIIQSKSDDVPVPTDVLTTVAPCSFRNIDNTRDIRVLSDNICTLDADRNSHSFRQLNIPFNGKIQWDKNTDTPAYGHIYVFLLGTIAPGANATICDWECRLRFVDN
jgi:hypothetical protein